MKVERVVVGQLATNCYLLISEQELAIVDPGDESEKILKQVKDTKSKAVYIINTHAHFDHVLASDELREKTGAKVLIHEAEKKFVNFQVDRFLKEKDRIRIGSVDLEVMHTPGHSPGGICLLTDGIIFTGDTLFKDGYGRTDLSGGSHEELLKSLKRISELLKPGMMVYPGHGESFQVQ
jgi:glyoxylase-like metal-dependent hydrolase (beta-lactamase superfamily II)